MKYEIRIKDLDDLTHKNLIGAAKAIVAVYDASINGYYDTDTNEYVVEVFGGFDTLRIFRDQLASSFLDATETDLGFE